MNTIILLIEVVILIYSVILHEVAHGYVAYKLGDPTAKLSKRLTLNPIPHIDPIMTIGLPAILLIIGSPILIGGAKPVPIDTYNFRNPKKDTALTAFAGPAANFLLAIFFGIILKGSEILGLGLVSPYILTALFSIVFINLILGIFNIIPIPPLDGYKIIGGIIPDSLNRIWRSFERYGFFILIPILFIFDHTLINYFALLAKGLANFLTT